MHFCDEPGSGGGGRWAGGCVGGVGLGGGGECVGEGGGESGRQLLCIQINILCQYMKGWKTTD